MPSPPNQRRILVVDDAVDNCKMLLRLLTRAGYAAECAFSGEDALSRLCANTADSLPDLVILDQMMPGLDGMEVLRRLRADHRTAALPVVIFSAVLDHAFQDYALSKGATAYWTKAGIDYSHLSDMVDQILRPASR